MRWLKGLIFIMVAIVSLGVILYWPRDNIEIYDKVPNNASILSLPKVETERGLPKVWLKELKIPGSDSANKKIVYSKKYTVKDSTNLLINLICWAIFMFIVEIALRGITKKVSK